MDFATYFPVWDRLTSAQQSRLVGGAVGRTVKKGTVLHSGADCTGLLLVETGQLRAYILSAEGREITLYRLFDLDICLFSASCMIRSLQFDITIETEKDTALYIIPAEIYQEVMTQSAPQASSFCRESVMAGRGSAPPDKMAAVRSGMEALSSM